MDQGFPKPGLVQWAADETARYALEHLDQVDKLGRFKTYDRWRKGRFETTDRAKAFGSDVHRMAETLAAGGEVDVPADAVGHVDACLRFLDVEEVQVLRSEQLVASAVYWYAGRFDLLADTKRGRALIDYKTGNSAPYHEAALQLAAYRYAEWWAGEDGSTVSAPDPDEIDLCAVVWLRPDRYELIPVDTTPATFRAFLYVAEVAKVTRADRSAYVGDPL